MLRVGMELKFVILHHTGAGALGGPHFDLLIEVDGMDRLMAWRVRVAPSDWAGIPDGEIGAVRIADHRRLYMTYEGEISADRGRVRRVAEGKGSITELSDGRLTILFVGENQRFPLSLPLKASTDGPN